MSWFKTRLGSSFFDLFSTSSPANLDQDKPVATLEDIREEMMLLLAGIDVPPLKRRVKYCLDVQGLWYLRGELLGVLAAHRGEAQAFEEIDALTPMFRGALPQGLVPRQSPLNTAPRGASGRPPNSVPGSGYGDTQP